MGKAATAPKCSLLAAIIFNVFDYLFFFLGPLCRFAFSSFERKLSVALSNNKCHLKWGLVILVKAHDGQRRWAALMSWDCHFALHLLLVVTFLFRWMWKAKHAVAFSFSFLRPASGSQEMSPKSCCCSLVPKSLWETPSLVSSDHLRSSCKLTPRKEQGLPMRD